jgi:hypothetical protein
MKRFHEALAGNAYECLLKSSIGKARLLIFATGWILSILHSLFFFWRQEFLRGEMGRTQFQIIQALRVGAHFWSLFGFDVPSCSVPFIYTT